MNITPLGNRIVVISDDPVEEKTAGGIIIPEIVQPKPLEATIIAVGEDVNDPELVPNARVLIGRYAGHYVIRQKTTYTIVREDEVLGMLEEESCN